jgi:hypothetical protein
MGVQIMSNYAIVKDGVVKNVIIWNGDKPYDVEGEILVEATADTQIGGSWDGNVFTFVEPTPTPPTAEQIALTENKASARSKLAALGLSEDEISAAFGI